MQTLDASMYGLRERLRTFSGPACPPFGCRNSPLDSCHRPSFSSVCGPVTRNSMIKLRAHERCPSVEI